VSNEKKLDQTNPSTKEVKGPVKSPIVKYTSQRQNMTKNRTCVPAKEKDIKEGMTKKMLDTANRFEPLQTLVE